MKGEVKTLPNFDEWLDGLDQSPEVRVLARISRLREDAYLGDHKRFEGLLELRFDNGLRIYALEHAPNLYLLLGGGKRGQARDIERAKALAEDLRKKMGR